MPNLRFPGCFRCRYQRRIRTGKTVVPVHGCRSISKKDMVWNDRTPVLTVDPETYKVTVDGEEITSKPAEKLPLTQLYSLF